MLPTSPHSRAASEDLHPLKAKTTMLRDIARNAAEGAVSWMRVIRCSAVRPPGIHLLEPSALRGDLHPWGGLPPEIDPYTLPFWDRETRAAQPDISAACPDPPCPAQTPSTANLSGEQSTLGDPPLKQTLHPCAS